MSEAWEWDEYFRCVPVVTIEIWRKQTPVLGIEDWYPPQKEVIKNIRQLAEEIRQKIAMQQSIWQPFFDLFSSGGLVDMCYRPVELIGLSDTEIKIWTRKFETESLNREKITPG